MGAAVKPTKLSMAEVEELVHAEADLLDQGDLEAWRGLFTEDGSYWMPVDPAQTDPHGHISIVYDDANMMAVRAANFGHRLAASMQYPVRCCHILGRVRLEEDGQQGEEIRVRCKFHVAVYYREQRVFAGTARYRLRRVDDQLRIVQKRVDLIDCDAAHKSIVTYL